jgi:hypothetical protein
MATEFRSEKIPRNRFRKVYGRVNSEARNGMELHEKNCFTKNPVQQTELIACFRLRNAKCFGTEFPEFASIFLFRGGGGVKTEWLRSINQLIVQSIFPLPSKMC